LSYRQYGTSKYETASYLGDVAAFGTTKGQFISLRNKDFEVPIKSRAVAAAEQELLLISEADDQVEGNWVTIRRAAFGRQQCSTSQRTWSSAR
jgi:phage gp45-like